MKKLIFSAALLASAVISNAQTMFGVQAGANFASVKQEFGGANINSDSKVGFTIGVLANADFGSSISFRPELNFIQKGGKTSMTNTIGGTTFSDKSDLVLNYIQLSPNFVYNIPAGSGKVFLGLGPEFGFGISGKDKSESTVSNGTTTSTDKTSVDVKFNGDDNATATDGKEHLKSFDFGGNLLGGYQLSNGAFISAGYTLGFANIIADNGFSLKNRGFNVKLGVMFGGSHTKAKK